MKKHGGTILILSALAAIGAYLWWLGKPAPVVAPLGAK